MKIGAVTLAYNDEGTIKGTINCLKPFVDRHVVLISECPYFGEHLPQDNTENICNDLGVDVVKGTWSLDHFQRSLGNQLMSDMDWVLGFDSDELITAEDAEKLIDFLSKTKAPAVAVKPEIYWNTPQYRLRPKPSYTPIIAMRPNVRFTYIRNIDSPFELWEGGEMHHLSWCKPKDILKKVLHYAHATDFNGELWYVEKFLKWQDGEKAELPDGIYDAVYNPLPQELYGHLEYKDN